MINEFYSAVGFNISIVVVYRSHLQWFTLIKTQQDGIFCKS